VKRWRVVGALAATTLVAAPARAFGLPAVSAVGSAAVPLACALVAMHRRSLVIMASARWAGASGLIIEAVVAGAFS
jgi:hypothetical protein